VTIRKGGAGLSRENRDHIHNSGVPYQGSKVNPFIRAQPLIAVRDVRAGSL